MKKAISGNTITFTFDGLEPVVFDTTATSAAVRERATIHGFMARLGDNAAISRNQPDGSVITVTEAMRREAVLELANHYASGTEDWNIGGRTRKPAPQNATILKVAAARGITYEQAEAYIAEKFMGELISL